MFLIDNLNYEAVLQNPSIYNKKYTYAAVVELYKLKLLLFPIMNALLLHFVENVHGLDLSSQSDVTIVYCIQLLSLYLKRFVLFSFKM